MNNFQTCMVCTIVLVDLIHIVHDISLDSFLLNFKFEQQKVEHQKIVILLQNGIKIYKTRYTELFRITYKRTLNKLNFIRIHPYLRFYLLVFSFFVPVEHNYLVHSILDTFACVLLALFVLVHSISLVQLYLKHATKINKNKVIKNILIIIYFFKYTNK